MQQNPPYDDPTSSTLFDWTDFLEFELEETLNIALPHTESQPEQEQEQPGLDQIQSPDNPGRVRKRDPKLVCPNFLAGRIPCACPEMDALLEKEEEEEMGLPGKKRTRTVRAAGGVPGRCQVPGCEVDISELKGYHKRHRVCLGCANASSVVLDGEDKRYCQQCGKFHLLPDFDEGKRSCRRKLERHNNRRRRKPNETKRGTGKESQQSILADDVSGDDDVGKSILDVSGDDDTAKDAICLSSPTEEREILLESQNLRSDSGVSFPTSGETHMIVEKQNPKYRRSESYSDNKNAFSSSCPSGRISFKLYDWNPAEFPRRLRHQIFEWLSNMPIELEGYIRPGCTILTAFIAMPKPVWVKLLEEPASCIKDLVASPQSMLYGRGTMLVHLNDMVFRVTKDATSIVKVKVKDRAPKLHYIYPTCFEAGRPMEFIACGSDLLQPKFRFLVSFAGKYMPYNISVSSVCCKKGDTNSFEQHQLLSIRIPQTDMDLYGPAFIEVENQSGLSNFIPILVGDKETCAEMEILQQKFDTQEPQSSPPNPGCEVFTFRQARFSEFILDVAYFLKKPIPEQKLTSSHIQRFNNLLSLLIEKESLVVLERVFYSVKAVYNKLVGGVSDADMGLLRKNMGIAQSMLDRKLTGNDFTGKYFTETHEDGNIYSQSSQSDDRYVITATNKGMQKTIKTILGSSRVFPPSLNEGAIVPLLNDEVVMNVNLHERRRKSYQRPLSKMFLASRPLIVVIAVLGICCGVCAVVLHPQKVNQIATTVRRCLFDGNS